MFTCVNYFVCLPVTCVTTLYAYLCKLPCMSTCLNYFAWKRSFIFYSWIWSLLDSRGIWRFVKVLLSLLGSRGCWRFVRDLLSSLELSGFGRFVRVLLSFWNDLGFVDSSEVCCHCWDHVGFVDSSELSCRSRNNVGFVPNGTGGFLLMINCTFECVPKWKKNTSAWVVCNNTFCRAVLAIPELLDNSNVEQKMTARTPQYVAAMFLRQSIFACHGLTVVARFC